MRCLIRILEDQYTKAASFSRMYSESVHTSPRFPRKHNIKQNSSPSLQSTSLWINAFLHLCLVCLQPALASDESLKKDLHALAATFPGCYSNVDQYYKHVQKGLPPEQRHFLLKMEIYKMASPMFNDSLSFYFQDFTKSSSEPFRSGFYSFSAETKMNVIRMRTLRLKNDVYIPGAFKKSVNFTLKNDLAAQALKKNGYVGQSLRTYSACDMFWKRLGDSTFVGITGPLCLGSLGTDQVRIGVSMTLSKDKLLLTESWYKLSDGTRITEVKVPYILQKLRLLSDKLVPLISHKQLLSSQDRMSNDVDPSEVGDDSFTSILSSTKNQYQMEDSTDGSKIMKRAQQHKKVVAHRILRNFRQVAAALTSGHNVYFRVELSACTIPDQVKVERLSFGGMIKNFMYVRQDGSSNERKDYIYFVSHKTVMGSQGPEFISRQLTLLREGRVKVEVIKTFSELSKVKQGYMFECKLFSDQTGYGGVKLALDPTSSVRRISGFSTLASSVDQGRDLHIVADLARCQGSRRKPAVIMGSQIINYDFVNGGKTVEIFLPFVQMLATGQGDVNKSMQGFMGQILKNGDVILTLISSSQSKHSFDNVFHLSSAYHCKLTNRNAVVTNDENEDSVKLFYIK